MNEIRRLHSIIREQRREIDDLRALLARVFAILPEDAWQRVVDAANAHNEILAALAGDPIAIAKNAAEVDRLRREEESE